MPVQRVPRYSMLVRDLIRVTPNDHHDYNDLMQASAEFETLVSKDIYQANDAQASGINEHVRNKNARDAFEKVRERGGGFEMLDKVPEPQDRMWLKESAVQAIYDLTTGHKNKKQAELILFTDILVARFERSSFVF